MQRYLLLTIACIILGFALVLYHHQLVTGLNPFINTILGTGLFIIFIIALIAVYKSPSRVIGAIIFLIIGLISIFYLRSTSAKYERNGADEARKYLTPSENRLEKSYVVQGIRTRGIVDTALVSYLQNNRVAIKFTSDIPDIIIEPTNSVYLEVIQDVTSDGKTNCCFTPHGLTDIGMICMCIL